MGDENLSLCTPYRTLFCHQSPSREDTTRSVPRDLGDSALSARPRPSLDPAPVSREERPTWHRTQGLFIVSSPTSPWGPGMAGHSWRTSLQPPLQGSTKLHLKAPSVPASSYPIKGQAQARGNKKRSKHQQMNKRRGKLVSSLQINISSNHPCTLSLPLRLGLGSLSHSL
jgi:hypothetical protein